VSLLKASFPAPPAPSTYDEIFARVEATLPGLVAEHTEALALWAELLGLPSAEARYQALGEPRFHKVGLARMLLAEAIRACPPLASPPRPNPRRPAARGHRGETNVRPAEAHSHAPREATAMIGPRAYVVVPVDPADVEAARAAGAEILCCGEAPEVARFVEALPQGAIYAVFESLHPSTPPAGQELARATLLRLDGVLAEVEGELVAAGARFSPLENAAMLEGRQPYDFPAAARTGIETGLSDFLKPLRRTLQETARYAPGPEGER
jgi:hypothetical protein